MTYEMAFIMVGRVALWILLILAPPALFMLSGFAASEVDELSPWEDRVAASFVTFMACLSYVAVVLCARFVQ